MDLLDSEFSAIYFAVELFENFLVHKGNGFYSLTLNLFVKLYQNVAYIVSWIRFLSVEIFA